MNSPGFEEIVSFHYESLYRFAFSLTRTEADAGDLTRLAFSIYAEKGQQLRDCTKAKSWLFTTLHRSFLQRSRKQNGFPRFKLSESEAKLPPSPASHSSESDRARIVRSLSQVDELCQTTVALFCLEDYTYREIAEILEIPPGMVKSRLSKGLYQLGRNYFADPSLSPNS